MTNIVTLDLLGAATVIAHLGLAAALLLPWFLPRASGRRGRRAANTHSSRLAITLLVVGVLVVGLQILFARPRPVGGPLHVVGLAFYGFPSGHAAIAFTAATYLAWIRRDRWAALALSAAGVVGAARVASGVHYPSDVIAGAALGAGCASVAFGWRLRPLARPRWAWVIFPWLSAMVLMTIAATVGVMPIRFTGTWAGTDKLLHFIAFGVVTVLAGGWFQRSAREVIAVIAALAILDENLQRLFPGRDLDPMDALASLGGVATFGLLLVYLGARAARRRLSNRVEVLAPERD